MAEFFEPPPWIFTIIFLGSGSFFIGNKIAVIKTERLKYQHHENKLDWVSYHGSIICLQ